MRVLLLEACTEPGVTMVMVAVATATPCTGSGGRVLLAFSPTAETYKRPSADSARAVTSRLGAS